MNGTAVMNVEIKEASPRQDSPTFRALLLRHQQPRFTSHHKECVAASGLAASLAVGFQTCNAFGCQVVLDVDERVDGGPREKF